MIQIGDTKAWLWVAVEPIHRVVLCVYISRHRNMHVAEHFLNSLVEKYGIIRYIQMVVVGILKPVLLMNAESSFSYKEDID
jgi:transposase-like protein